MIYGPPDRRIPSKIAHYSDLIVLAPGSGLQTIPSLPQMIQPAFVLSYGAGIAAIGSSPIPQAQRYGAETTLPNWRERLVCSECRFERGLNTADVLLLRLFTPTHTIACCMLGEPRLRSPGSRRVMAQTPVPATAWSPARPVRPE